MRDENRKKSMRLEEIKVSDLKLLKKASVTYEDGKVPSKAGGSKQAVI
jgi:hypothetical protein